MSNYQGRNFGFAPPMVNEQQQTPQKKALPAQLIPPDAVHTGDGWTFQPRPDHTVALRIVNPIDGSTVAQTVLIRPEWIQVRDAIDPPKPAVEVTDELLETEYDSLPLEEAKRHYLVLKKVLLKKLPPLMDVVSEVVGPPKAIPPQIDNVLAAIATSVAIEQHNAEAFKTED